jgi:hypothetical protein
MGVGRERGGRGRKEGWREAGREMVRAQAGEGVGAVGLVYSIKTRSALREDQVRVDFPWDAVGRIHT